MFCVISQPAFLPWLGWFDMADQADVMVILDDVSFSKQSWQQRNRIRTKRGLEYVTVPVKTAGRLGQKINECELNGDLFVRKITGSLYSNYSNSPWFRESFDHFCGVMAEGVKTGMLAEFNYLIIKWIAEKLDIATPMIRSSSLLVDGKRGEYVAAICHHLGVSHYLSAAGSEAYLLEDRKAFELHGIEVFMHVYEHPVYQQRFDPFLPYACSLDLIFNEGPNAPLVLRSGRRPSRPLGQT